MAAHQASPAPLEDALPVVQPVDPPIAPPGELDLPYSDGQPLESDRHVQQINLLITTLRQHWRPRDDFFVGGNMFVYFSETQTRRNDFRGPDVFVVLDTVKRERRSWVVWQEGGRTPDVVVELLSESTASVDRGEKKRIYERVLKVSEYFLYDPFSAELEGFRLGDAGYEPIEPDADGRMRSTKLDLELGRWCGVYADIEATWVRWCAPGGDLVPTVEELAAGATARAEAESVRAEAESVRADAESARALELERRLAAYTARFGPLDSE